MVENTLEREDVLFLVPVLLFVSLELLLFPDSSVPICHLQHLAHCFQS